MSPSQALLLVTTQLVPAMKSRAVKRGFSIASHAHEQQAANVDSVRPVGGEIVQASAFP